GAGARAARGPTETPGSGPETKPEAATGPMRSRSRPFLNRPESESTFPQSAPRRKQKTARALSAPAVFEFVSLRQIGPATIASLRLQLARPSRLSQRPRAAPPGGAGAAHCLLRGSHHRRYREAELLLQLVQRRAGSERRHAHHPALGTHVFRPAERRCLLDRHPSR